MRALTCLMLLCSLAVPLFAWGHADHKEDVIKARRAYFTLFAANIGPLAEMAKGERPYDADIAKIYAHNFTVIAAYDPTPHFASGTSSKDFPGETRALPEIWENMPGFGEHIVAFNKAVEALQAAAGQGRAELGPAVQKLGATCKGCHDDFRAKDF